jgi:hypothetical protein
MRFLRIVGVISLLGWSGGVRAAAHDCGHHNPHCGDCQDCGRHWQPAPRARRGPAASGETANLETVEGRINEVIYLYGATADAGMVEIRVQAAGKAALIRLAPSGFLTKGGLRLREGDTVVVKGFPVAGMEGDLIVATEIGNGSSALALRDAQGRPRW